MAEMGQDKKHVIAQWTFDTRSILGRFHLWLEDVEVRWTRGKETAELTSQISFLDSATERRLAMTGAVTALGTKLFGRFGEGANMEKSELNQVKKDADAISAYAMSECLWFLSRQLPENHAIMVCLGEGLMPKVGETPEMGSNPQLGFGRVYGRPEVARWIDKQVVKLLNNNNYSWSNFYQKIKDRGITVWGAAIDTLENTSRFAKGKKTGSLTILHLFDQPLHIAKPYEGYMGNLIVPKDVVKKAEDESILINFRTPRSLVLRAIELTYPGIKKENIHIWTLRGKSREGRIGGIWKAWQDLGAHLIDDDWELPSGMGAFTESGTYAPTYNIGSWRDKKKELHLLICDGYAASAEAMQAASLAPLLNLRAFLAVFTSSFKLPYFKEQYVMALDPENPDFEKKLEGIAEKSMDDDTIAQYREMIRDGLNAGIPLKQLSIEADDFLPEKKWDVLAVSGFMCPDPYSGADGIEKISDDTYKVTTRISSKKAEKMVTLSLRLMKPLEINRLVFKPLLIRFMGGEDYKSRPVRISDSGRIRNEIQTICSEALEYHEDETLHLHFDRIPPEVISKENQKKLVEVLNWFKKHHPIWFSWLEIV